MAKRGRPRRSTVKREANGRAQRSAPVKPELVIAQRETLVGKGQAVNPMAGRPIGVLRLNAVITEAQFLAAEQFEHAWRRWAKLAGAKPHHAQCGEREGGTAPDPSEASWDKAKAAYDAAAACIDGCEQNKLVWAILDTLLMECVLPHTWGSATVHSVPERVTTALRRGLDALCRHYRIKDAEAA